MKSIYCIALSLVVGLCLGCGRSTSVTGPKGEKATVTEKGDAVEVNFKGRNGEEVHYAGGQAGVALPDGFPKDLTVYPKATIVTSATMGKTITVSLKTADSAQKAEAFYKEKLKENGWEIESSVNTPQGIMLHGKKEGRTATIVISTQTGETMINIVVAE